jgi:hypothetical protein
VIEAFGSCIYALSGLVSSNSVPGALPLAITLRPFGPPENPFGNRLIDFPDQFKADRRTFIRAGPAALLREDLNIVESLRALIRT